MIAFYNKNIGNILMLVVADSEGQKVNYERRDDVTRVFRTDNQQTVAWNIFGYEAAKNGEVKLSSEEIVELNQKIAAAGFTEQVEQNKCPGFVVAKVLKAEPHPDSDHLNICQVDVGQKEAVQIVCGAPNVYEGMVTVAALPICMMPSGKLIFDGELRGVASHGMLCSARELALPNAPEQRGIIELTDNEKVGEAFTSELWHG